MDKIQSLTGMLDQYDDGDMSNTSSKLFEVEKIIKNIFLNYKFQEIRTPVLEDANLFIRSVGDSSDIVNKEIYSFNDRNDKTIAMRPEGTASVIRSVIEKKYFNNHGIEVSYNGHPLVEHIERFVKEVANSKEEFYSKYELDHKKENILLLPGSREQEIEKKLPVMLNACKDLEDQFNIVIGGINHLEHIYHEIGLESNVTIIYDDTYNILNNSRVAFVTSGTATLETAFFNVPQIVCYKSSWISYQIAKTLVKVNYISLVNLILNKETVKELIQSDLSVVNLKNNLDYILNKKSYLETILHDYKHLKKLCQGNNVPKLTAKEMLKTIGG